MIQYLSKPFQRRINNQANKKNNCVGHSTMATAVVDDNCWFLHENVVVPGADAFIDMACRKVLYCKRFV